MYTTRFKYVKSRLLSKCQPKPQKRQPDMRERSRLESTAVELIISSICNGYMLTTIPHLDTFLYVPVACSIY